MTKELQTATNSLPTYKGETAIKNTELAPELCGSGFMPSLRLMTSMSNVVKQGKFPMNHFALASGGDPIDLGKEVDLIVLSWRPKALDMSDESNIISIYDIEDPMWKDIVLRSSEADSHCSFGPEYLVYIPSQKAYATFHCGSKTARNEAKNIHNYLPQDGAIQSATFGSYLIETKKYSWQAANVRTCPNTLSIGDSDAYLKAMEDFLNPKVVERELAPEGGDDESRR